MPDGEASQRLPSFDNPFADVAPVAWAQPLAPVSTLPPCVADEVVAVLSHLDLAERVGRELTGRNFEAALQLLYGDQAVARHPAARLLRGYLHMLLGHSDDSDDEFGHVHAAWGNPEARRYVETLMLFNRTLTGRGDSSIFPDLDQRDGATRVLAAIAAWTASAEHARDHGSAPWRTAECDDAFPHLAMRLDDFAGFVDAVLGDAASEADLDIGHSLPTVYVKHKFLTSTIVYRASVNAMPAAIKIIRFYNGYSSPREVREAAVLSHLGCERVPRCLWSRQYDNGMALATSWVDGAPLARTKGKAKATAGQLRDRFPTEEDWRAVRTRFQERLALLSRAGVVHGDLSFDNVLLDGEEVALIDFGLAAIAPTAAEAEAQNAAALAVVDKMVTDMVSHHWAAARTTQPHSTKESSVSPSSSAQATKINPEAPAPEAMAPAAAPTSSDLYGGFNPADITTLAQLREALDRLYASEKQQFQLTKFYQSYNLIGIDEAFRSSERRFAFYAMPRWVHKWHSVLDIGCNTGFLSMMLAPFVRRLCGVDATKSLVDIASLTANFLGHSNCQFECCEFTRFQTSERFDVVLDLAAHGWIDLPFETFAGRVDAMLKPGGIFAVESHHLQNSADRDFDHRVKLIEANGYALLDRRAVPETGDRSPREFCVFRKPVAS